MPTLEKVFGISAKPVLSYVEREKVDGRLRDSLTSDRHIVIYGASKQGKTALRQKHIPADSCTILQCSPKSTIEGLYQAVLRDMGVIITSVETTTTGGKVGAKAKWGFKAALPLFGGTSGEAEASGELSRQKATQSNYVGFDMGDAQSITELLRREKYSKFVVLENFHYLQDDVQRQLAFDLKTFHEVGVRFIVLGIWKEANYLLVYNGDLQDRFIEIPVEPWEDDAFDKVLEKGSEELHIAVAPEIAESFKKEAHGNIGLFQEFLRSFCRISGVVQDSEIERELNGVGNMERAFNEKVEDQRGRLANLLQTIASRSRTNTHTSDPLVLPYYLVKVLLSAPLPELADGIRRSQLLEKMKALHSRSIRMSDLSSLLKRIPNLQAGISPPFLYYDRDQGRLKIVDATQFFVLSRINRDELGDEIPDPRETYSEAQTSLLNFPYGENEQD